jgi:DNA-binding HxlR family transcriptional regulator
MASSRTYGEACAAAHALDLVGERWALLIVRELLLGPKRFTDLRAGILHASPNVLAQRLRELEQAGIVQRRKLPPPAASQVYELTGWGMELEPVIIALGHWGCRSPALPREAEMSVDSHILAMRTLFDAEAAGDLCARLELRLGEHHFHAVVEEGQIELDRGAVERPDAILTADPGTLAALLWEGRPLAAALRSGEARIEGDALLVERCLGLFPLPDPVVCDADALAKVDAESASPAPS